MLPFMHGFGAGRLVSLGYLLTIAVISGVLAAGCASGGSAPPPRGDGGNGGTDGAVEGGTECTTNADCVDDGIFCNGTVSCQDGHCVPSPAPTCDDSVACTMDTCPAAADACQNTPDDSLCPSGTVCEVGMGCVAPAGCEFDTDCAGDGVFCNGAEVCVSGSCVSPGMRDCSDDDSCTVDECVESMSACTHTPADSMNDPMHCGPTGMNDCVVCPDPTVDQVHAAAACQSGSCGIACQAGYADADHNPANGCECEIGAGPDDPDAAFVDSNCDGIDGDLAHGILVSGSMGNDNATCGLAFPTPCRTIGYAITRAVTESRHDLFVMAGTYDEVVTLRDGIRIFGGYDTSWVRASRSDPAHRTVIEGGLDSDNGQYLTIEAHDLIVAPMLENLVLIGPDAVGPGASSYVIHTARIASLDVVRTALQAGNGAVGAAGVGGVNAAVVTAGSGMAGGSGGPADQFVTLCDNTSRGGGGSPGTNSCPSSTATNGGTGGAGGTMDTDCSFPSSDLNARPGAAGTAAAYVSGTYGTAGGGGATCTIGGAGQGGRVVNGAAGMGATNARGTLAGDFWVGASGGSGGGGANGSGGGGGGGSGGCDTGTDSYGAGGGGGGAGGCAAQSGGGGGGPGGGSFGLFAVASTVTLTACDVQRGNGGTGGAGGDGGRGQSGGPSGPGGTAKGGSPVGGTGGAGGHGGHGGGGGGGAGGVSIGIFSSGSTITADCTFSAGSAGGRGTGGLSAPTAPLAERDGNNGTGGVVGIVADVDTCASPSGC